MGSGLPKPAVGSVGATTVPLMVVTPLFGHCDTPVMPPVPHTFGLPAPQAPVAQVPQLITPPQPSPAKPQLKPSAAQVVGLHAALPPHWNGVPPPPQVCGHAQLPQSITPPQ